MSPNRDAKNLKSVARAYGSRLIQAVYRECSEEMVRLEAQSNQIQLPARDEQRNSIGIDRCLIPDARIGWTVHLYDTPPKSDSRPLTSGKVRKFVPREGRQDMTIVRLSSPLNMKPLLNSPNQSNLKASTKMKSKSGDDEKPGSEPIFSSSVVLYAIVENPTLSRRCLRTYFAIDAFMRIKCSQPIAKLLIGDLYPNPITWNHPPSELILPSCIDFKLTKEQNRALQIAIKKHITVIEGTVGSGKTHLAACIAHCLAVQKYQKILVCSPNSSTIDLLASLLMSTATSCQDSLSVIQVTNADYDYFYDYGASLRGRNCNDTGNSATSLKSRLMERLSNSCRLDYLVGWELYCKFLDKHHSKYKQVKDIAEIERLTERTVAICCKATRKKVQRRLLDHADIICCTIEQAGRKLINRTNFDVLIIDDAQYASDADILIPLMIPKLKQIILIGQDDIKLNMRGTRQLQSTMVDRNLGQERYRLFSRLINSYGPLARLTQQFRAHEKLIEFCNGHFYKSRLRTNASVTRRFVRRCMVDGDFSWFPKLGDSMSAIIAIQSDQHLHRSSMHSINSTIEKITTKLVELEKFAKSSITIVTNIDYLENKNQSLNGVEVRNILDMVGLENEFIILSCQQASVRCHRMSHELEPDFTRNEQALHIALTRARLGLFVVADQSLIDTVINFRNNNNDSSMSQSSSKSVVWIDQESNDFSGKWRNFINYHQDSERILSADQLE